jgi:hypothetical protein
MVVLCGVLASNVSLFDWYEGFAELIIGVIQEFLKVWMLPATTASITGNQDSADVNIFW